MPENSEGNNQIAGVNKTDLKRAAKIGGVAGLAAAIGLKFGLDFGMNQPRPDQTPAEPTPIVRSNEPTSSPEILGQRLEFGFNTHVHAFPQGADNMTLDNFRMDVDKLVENHQELIRFNLINDGVVNRGPDGAAVFGEKISVYDEAVKYAKEKGLKVFLVTNVPEFAANLPIDQYADVARDFYTKLMNHFRDVGIDLNENDKIQLFNEVNTHNFRTYQGFPPEGFDDAYLNDLAQVVEASSSAIQAVNPNIKTTMNAGWVYGAGTYQGELDQVARFFDPLAPHLDFISLDPYPDIYDPHIAQTIPQAIEFLKNRYKKGIIVAELGVSAYDISDTNRRAQILNSQLSAIRSGNVLPLETYIYEMRNEESIRKPDGSLGKEGQFGTQDIYNQIVTQMEELTRPAPTPNA